MHCVDANVLVYAHRQDVDRHHDYRDWLDAARVGDEPLGISDLVLSAFLRVVTHHRVFAEPTPLQVAIDFAEGVRSSPATVVMAPGSRHWSIFTRLCTTCDARGNLVPDAYFAALAIESGSTWVTADRGFSRFIGLTSVHPLARAEQ